MTQTATQEFVIARSYPAPIEKVYQAWTEPERMKQWFGPEGFTMPFCRTDLRPGGTTLYAMQGPDGAKMWGKLVYREIVPRQRIVAIHSFSDEKGGLTRHPLIATWPLEWLSTVSFGVQGGLTAVTVVWLPIHPAPEEARTFADGREDMQKGWGDSLERLGDYLAKP